MKLLLSSFFNFFLITRLFSKCADLYYGKNLIRVVNYHGTPEAEKENFEQQLIYYQKNYASVSEEELEDFMKSGVWKKDKPGLIISFDDGQRSNFDFAYPLLNKYNFIGWFFIPTDFIDNPVEKQEEFMKINEFHKNQLYVDKRYAMTWEEVIELSKTHVIGSHTKSHHEVAEGDPIAMLKEEVFDSKKILEDKLAMEITSFCWVRGRLTSYSNDASKLIKEAGYRFSFMTNTYPVLKTTNALQIQRTNIETKDPLHVVKFQLCGFMDLMYYKKRKKIIDLTTN